MTVILFNFDVKTFKNDQLFKTKKKRIKNGTKTIENLTGI